MERVKTLNYILNIPPSRDTEKEFSVLDIVKTCISLKIDSKTMYTLKYQELLYLILGIQIDKAYEIRKLEESQNKDYEEVDATNSDILKGTDIYGNS